MADEARRSSPDSSPPVESEVHHERSERGLTDMVKRAMSAGLEAATRSKDDLVRVATSEMRSWLDHLDVQSEIAKVLSKMVVEVKAEIRFRPKEDGQLVPEATSEVKIKPPA